MRIEAAKERVGLLPLSSSVLRSLRETARLYTTHCSTLIEGNQLSPEEVQAVLHLEGHFPGRERDEAEVKGYYAALAKVEQYAAQGQRFSENSIQVLHALVMGEGRTLVKPSPYRDGQNVIRDSRSGSIRPLWKPCILFSGQEKTNEEPECTKTVHEDSECVFDTPREQKTRFTKRSIVYIPPVAKDVPSLMRQLVTWVNENSSLPCPLVAAIAHYQFATIHPYYDGNGRTARLITTLILHL